MPVTHPGTLIYGNSGGAIFPLKVAADGTLATSATLSGTVAASTLGTLTSVAASATSVTLAVLNAARLALVVVNDSTAILYVALAATASATSFTYKLAAGDTIELPSPGYTGIVTGIWASATGSARLTEMT